MLNTNWLTWQRFSTRILSFFLGEYFTDALRNTLVIVLPITFFFIQGYPQAAIGIGVGALLISLTDLPGNRTSKFRTAVLSICTFFLTALIISCSLRYEWVTAAAFFLLTFLLSMLSIFGFRSALTGTMAIILSTFTLGLHPEQPLLFSCYIFLGGFWYYLVSLVQISIWPYKYLHHAIFECLTSTARFLKVKAKCYDTHIPLGVCYQETISLHIKVSEKQDLVRTLLLSDKYAMDPANSKGKRMLATAKMAIGLYEQVTAIHYDYNVIRNILGQSGCLPLIFRLIEILAEELKTLSSAFLRSRKSRFRISAKTEFDMLMNALTISAEKEKGTASDIILKIQQNVSDIESQIRDISSLRIASQLDSDQKISNDNYSAFLSPQSFSPGFFKRQFNLDSTIFRFSLRLSLSFLAAYLLTLLFPSEKYSYWMLLTIVIVARPRFGITWKRNKERLWGTLTGVVIGFLVLVLVKQHLALLILSAMLLLGFFTFNRIRYAVSVMCITPAVIICLSLYHGHADHILSERIYYTLAGCAIAFAGVYLFPVWESRQLKALTGDAIGANINFFREVMIQKRRGPGVDNGSSLARKNAHLVLARFSEAFQHIHLEPLGNKIDVRKIEEVQELNYRINAVITSLFLSGKPISWEMDSIELADRVLADLRYSFEISRTDYVFNITSSHDQQLMPLQVHTRKGISQLELLAALSAQLREIFT
jgi:uncharacterized membrane protein YccC